MLALVVAAVIIPAGQAHADTIIDGPIGLGDAARFGVLGSTTVTNTGPSIVTGDVGVHAGSAITGFPPGLILDGSTFAADAVAGAGQADLTTAYGVASSLTPSVTGLADLSGRVLGPGVYSGEVLSLNGSLTLQGEADSVWVFQSASTFITGSSSTVSIIGGASTCNVFWRVGSSATLGSGSTLVGTVMANVSITANSTALIQGRLLARTGAVTLDATTITRPTSCDVGEVTASPDLTSGPSPDATAGTDYSSGVVATGTPTPQYSVTDGELPDGLTLDIATGAITGTPTTPGVYVVEITASNGVAQDDVGDYTITVAAPRGPGVDGPAGVQPGATLPPTGADPAALPMLAAGVLALGLVLAASRTLARRRRLA